MDRDDQIAEIGRRFRVDLEKTAERMQFFSDRKLYFVLYENGTCIFMKQNDRVSVICNAAMDVVAGSPPDFSVRDMKDGNYLVAFKDPVHALVLREEFERDRPLVEANEANLKLPSEALAAPKGTSPAHLLVGLYARARLFADLRDRRVHRTVEPNVSST